MSELRQQVIRLAHSQPQLREALLPLLREGTTKQAGWAGLPVKGVAKGKAKRLLDAVQKAMAEYAAEVEATDEKFYAANPDLNDKYRVNMARELEDAGIWVGDAIARYVDKSSMASLVLHYDGGAHDYLSYSSSAADPLRERISKAAHRVGFMMEDINGWSMGFYED